AALPREKATGQIDRVTPLTTARAQALDPGHRTTDPIDTIAVGVPADAVSTMEFDKRLPGLTTDAQVWNAVATRTDYVVLDAFFAATGGPPGQWYEPGDR